MFKWVLPFSTSFHELNWMQNLGVLSPKGNQHLAEAPAATPVLPGPGPTPVVPPAPYPGMSAAGAARMATGEARSKKVKVQEFRGFCREVPLAGS